PILTRSINKSIDQCTYPNLLKIAKVIPILKKDDPNVLINYRPISLLSVFPKILERILFNRSNNFLKQYNLFSKFQFEYRKNKSTEQLLLSIKEYILFNFRRGNNIIIGNFSDLSKAFDIVDHRILCKKLTCLELQDMH